MEKYADGFSLAEMDLKFRGSGEIYGTAQSGFPEFKIATLFDHELMQQAQEEAKKLLDEDGELKNHTALKRMIDDHGKTIHLE
jgi:ATP-dependent DNA helicase RecG